jgi:DNA-3-methyladenine glycosylase II
MSYRKHLRKDPVLAPLIVNVRELPGVQVNIPIRLMSAIVSQQLSTRVAAVIWSRFLGLYNGREPSCKRVLETPTEKLRSVGLSEAKVNYVKSVASFWLEQKITAKRLSTLSDEEVIQLLTQIKGVGVWTVQMLLMFSLGREDVFAPDDGGIQKAMAYLYGLEDGNKRRLKDCMNAIAEQWSPFRSYACLHLWEWKDSGLKTSR